MPRPSYPSLLNQLSECRRELGELSTDEAWNVTTFKAIPFQLRRIAESARFVVVVKIHTSLSLMTGRELNGSIRRALNFRAPQVLLRARWDNNEEAVFVLSEDPEVFCARLRLVLKNEGLHFSMAFAPYSGNIQFDHNRIESGLIPQVYTESEQSNES